MVGDRMPDCAMARFSLTGEASSDDLAAIGPVLAQMVHDAGITETRDGLHVEGVMDGADAREVNRELLSALRRAEKRTGCGLNGPATAISTGSLTTCQRARVPPRRSQSRDKPRPGCCRLTALSCRE